MEYEDKLPIARKRKAEWLKGKCCCKCGATHDLSIEYRDPKLGFQVWMWVKPKRRARELAKAQVWCAEHFRERMREKRGCLIAVEHGTAQMYRRGCRCADCKRAIAKYEFDRVHGLLGRVVKP